MVKSDDEGKEGKPARRKRRYSTDKIAVGEHLVENKILEINLRAIRELIGKTPAEVSRAYRTSGAKLSSAQKRQDQLFSILRSYVEALGGEVEVTARWGDKSVRLGL